RILGLCILEAKVAKMRSKTVTQSDPHSGAWQQRHSSGSRNNNSGKGASMRKEQNLHNNVSTTHDSSRSGNSHLDISVDGSNINEGGGRSRGGNINSSAIGEGGRNIQIDIGADDLNISTGRGRRGRGGNRGRGGGGIRSRIGDVDGDDRGSRRGGGSNINVGSKYQPRSVSAFSSPCKRLLVATTAAGYNLLQLLQEVASCCNT
ncbi:hypothetical protein Ancab_014316, partial [Ancistrocladus abbreviatus]